MASLKELVEKHGFDIWVDNYPDLVFGSYPFKILYDEEDSYIVEYENGRFGKVLQEYKSTNDYHLCEKLNEKI